MRATDENDADLHVAFSLLYYVRRTQLMRNARSALTETNFETEYLKRMFGLRATDWRGHEYDAGSVLTVYRFPRQESLVTERMTYAYGDDLVLQAHRALLLPSFAKVTTYVTLSDYALTENVLVNCSLIMQCDPLHELAASVMSALSIGLVKMAPKFQWTEDLRLSADGGEGLSMEKQTTNVADHLHSVVMGILDAY